MINGFTIKRIIAQFYDFCGLSDLKIQRINSRYKNEYIRIVNYHHIKDVANFEKQLQYYGRHFNNVNYAEFESFLKTGKMLFDKPGIIISFDDGYDDNYKNAKPILESHNMTGWFMVSSDLIGTTGYMSYLELRELVSKDHVIGCHTATHHRMLESDTREILEREIFGAKKKLETNLGSPVNIFCWCGGEEEYYTLNAEKMIIAAGYKYGFMTNSYPVLRKTDYLHIQRINVEDSWSIPLVKLQICGFMDKRFKRKRQRVNIKTGYSNDLEL